jgi:hypothetical protein
VEKVMIKKIRRNRKWNTVFLVTTLSVFLSLVLTAVHATPVGPTVTILGNETKETASATKVNASINDSISPGGYIFTANLNSLQQNMRWKAYVGNVTGTLTLDDANDNTIFQWSLSTVTGEVYATRASGNINWSGINCTWIADGQTNPTQGYENSNRSAEHDENEALGHTNRDDNITATFRNTNHTALTIGSVVIGKDECFSIQTWQNDNAQVFDDSANANFTEVILYDGALGKAGGNIIYVTEIEDDITGYRSDSTYDFQMLLPENGAAGFSSSTAYYFYVELA